MANLYGYGSNGDEGPTPSHTLAFTCLFALGAIIQTFLAIRKKYWWLLATLGLYGLFETIGWGSRYGSTKDLESMKLYAIQSSMLVIGPCFFTAFIYVQLGKVIKDHGPQYSMLKPKLFGILFVTADVFCILIQGSGGGISSSGDNLKMGSNLTLAGIILQFLCVLAYTVFLVDFCRRYYYNIPFRRIGYTDDRMGLYDGKEKLKLTLMLTMLSSTTILVIIRSIYRIAELSNGFESEIAKTQVLFDVLDGAMMLISYYITIGLHPAFLQPRFYQMSNISMTHQSSLKSDYNLV